MERLRYEKPKTKEALIGRLAELDGKVRLLAGGTDLLGQIRGRLIRPQLVLDLKGAEELHRLEAGPSGLAIGAAVILNRLLEERAVTESYRALTQAISDLASYTIRNRATLVGNVTNASPCADTVPPLCVMGARVEITGPSGVRELPVQEFITGVREVKLGRGELVTRILVPSPAPGTWSGFLKRKRVKGHDLALANVALLRDAERKQLRLSVGACNPTPVVVCLDDMFARPDEQEAVRRAEQQVHPIDDVRASIEYRRDMVGTMVRRLLAEMVSATKQ
jgi:CO/xanthine dehydrogenase FAD-binding subunit